MYHNSSRSSSFNALGVSYRRRLPDAESVRVSDGGSPIVSLEETELRREWLFFLSSERAAGPGLPAGVSGSPSTEWVSSRSWYENWADPRNESHGVESSRTALSSFISSMFVFGVVPDALLNRSSRPIEREARFP